MAGREMPAAWVSLLEKVPLPIVSVRDLAREVGVSPGTASRLVHGEGVLTEVIAEAASVLGVSVEAIQRARGQVPRPPFVLPADAGRLTQRQRALIVALVREMLRLLGPEKPPAPPTPEQEQADVDAGLLDELGTERESDRNGPEENNHDVP